MEISEKLQKKMIGLLSVLFPDAKIYLFGSRATKNHHPQSDIDIAIDNGKRIDPLDIYEAYSIMEALVIPVKVDVVDYRSVSAAMRDSIDNEKVVWKE